MPAVGSPATSAAARAEALRTTASRSTRSSASDKRSGDRDRPGPRRAARRPTRARRHLTVSSGPGQAQVPLGRRARARRPRGRKLLDAGFEVEDPREGVATTSAKGDAIGTAPSAGSQVDKGGTVTLIVSSGKQQVAVPDVVGQERRRGRADARATPASRSASASRRATDADEGTVLSQNPAAGTKLPKGSTGHARRGQGARAGRRPEHRRRRRERRAIERCRRRASRSSATAVDSPARTTTDRARRRTRPAARPKQGLDGDRHGRRRAAPRPPTPTTSPGDRRRGTHHAGDHAMRVAVLAGGRSSEHDVSLASGRRRCARAWRRPATRSSSSSSRATGRGATTGEELALHPGRGLLGADAVFPVAPRPVRRGRHRPGAARAARRAVRRLRACWPARCAWTRSSSRS